MPPPNSIHKRLVAIALSGDVAVFLVFAFIGRSNHHEAVNAPFSVIGTALPFIAGWLIGALVGGAYRSEAFQVLGGLRRVSASWLVGGLVALSIRSLLEHRVVPLPFVAVALIFNFVLLLVWRSALFSAMRWRERTRATQSESHHGAGLATRESGSG